VYVAKHRRQRRLTPQAGPMALALGACLCAGQLFSSAPALAATPTTTVTAIKPATVPVTAALVSAKATIVKPKVSLWAQHSSIKAGQSTLVFAHVTDPRTGKPATGVHVTLQRFIGNKWQNVRTKGLPSNGTAAYLVAPGSARSYRVNVSGRAGVYSATTSGTMRVTVAAAAGGGGGTSAVGARAVALAAQQTGKPYVFGAAGPSSFDCSGLTMYVYKKLGVSLPHKADLQQHYGRAIAQSAARPGDLIFFRTGTYAYHVAIFAGNGYMYDAPRPGQSVGKHRIWSNSYVVRRLVG
jgi:cell wall-associated NlpC family hydrolase